MSEKITSTAEFSAIWKAALKEFHANTSISLANEDGLLHLQNVDGLLEYLTKEHAQYDEDSASSKFTSVVKSTLGPLNFLLGTGGKVAGDMFPGGSHVLSALSIFVEAGRAVTESFEAVAKLFTRIENFASRMRTVSEEGIPPGLIPIYQTMLVSLLNICGLSIKITSRYLVAEGKTGKKSHRQNFLRKIRAPYANVAEYVKQLIGGNIEINDAVANLNDLVVFETSMMQASTLTEVMRIKAFTMNIQGLTIELGKTMSKSQSESNFRLSYIQQSQDRMEEKIIDFKKAQSQTNAKLDSMVGTIAERVGRMMSSGIGRQQNETQETKTSVSKELKRWEKLAAALDVEGAKELNKAFYERIRQERVRGTTDWILEDTTVKSWIQGEIPFVVMSGATGNGKTFTASRVVEQLITSKANSSDPDKAVAYFFCRRGPYERSSVIMALKTMAYDIASSDQLFAKHLSDLIKDRKLQSNRTASRVNLTATTIDSADSIVAEGRSTAAKLDQLGAQLDSITAEFHFPPGKAPELTDSTEAVGLNLEPKLRRVSTAVIQDKPLDDIFEEATVWDVQRHWNNLFVLRPQSFERHVYLILDGLDECDETEAIALCAAMNASASTTPTQAEMKVHVLLFLNTDRVTMFKNHALTSATTILPDLNMITADIGRFVSERISSAWKEKLVRRQLREDSCKAVVGNCNSNFLKASLLVNEVTSFTREDVVRDNLSNLPSLANTVQSAMLLVIKRLANQLDSYDREDFHDILAWVSCTHRELSLAELDAVLTLRKPGGARILDLEEKLRETFASLFSVTGEKIFEQKTADQLMSSRLSFIDSTQIYKEVMSVEATIEDIPGSPIARTSGLHEVVDKETSAVRRATANLRKNNVSLSHTMIAEEIQKHVAQAGLTDFTTASMQAMVLLRCIEALCEDGISHDKQCVTLARGYCSIYLPEHLQGVKPSDVTSSDMKTKIAKGLIKLLRDPLSNAIWVESGERYLADDLLGKPDFSQRVLEWLKDDTVQSHLSDDEREWHNRAVRSPVPTLFEGMARAVAHRWLACLDGYSAYADHYGFLKTYQESVAQHASSDAMTDNKDTKEDPGTMRTASNVPSRALRSASTADILRVAESTSLQQNCRWFQRIGSMIRSERSDYNDAEQYKPRAVELESFDINSRPDLTYDDAIRMYSKALEIDSSDGVARSGIALAFAAQGKYEDAAREAKAAVEHLSEAIRNGEKSPNPEYSLLTYKIETQQEYASHCINAGNLDEGFRAYECAVKDLLTFDTTGDAWEEMALATASYFYDLITNKRWDDAGSLLARLNVHPQRSSDSFHIIYRCIAFNEFQLLQLGYHSRHLTSVTEFMNHALSSTARQDLDAEVANVVDTFANILLRLDKNRVDDAIMILEALVGQSHMDDFIKSRAEREIARHCLTRMLQEREVDHWQAVAEDVHKLIRMANGDETSAPIGYAENKDCCRVLAACYRIHGLQKRAMNCVRSDITLGIDLLLDTDPDNDMMAWHTLMDSLLAVGDTTRAVAAVNMLRAGLFEDSNTSDKTIDKAHPDGDDTARSDGDTRAGANDEISGESQDTSKDSALTLTTRNHADQTRTVDEDPLISVGLASTIQTPKTAQMPEEEESSAYSTTQPTAVIDPPAEDGQAHEAESSKANEPALNPGFPFFRCDGCCFDMIANDAPMWRCSYCIADFCKSCHELVMGKKMTGWNVCDSLHCHVPVPAITKTYPKDMIKVGKEDISVVEWVQGLREEWKYSKAGT